MEDGDCTVPHEDPADLLEQRNELLRQPQREQMEFKINDDVETKPSRHTPSQVLPKPIFLEQLLCELLRVDLSQTALSLVAINVRSNVEG